MGEEKNITQAAGRFLCLFDFKTKVNTFHKVNAKLDKGKIKGKIKVKSKLYDGRKRLKKGK